METLTYEVDGRIARITLNRPERGNGITLAMPRELAECVERANLDPAVHVIALSGAGKGFCGGYDLVEFAERELPNHDPSQPWDAVVDWQMMSRNLRGFMSPVRFRQAGDLQGARILRGGRHGHGALRRSARDRRRCADRIPARARVGRPDLGPVGFPDRRAARQAAALHRRPDRRAHGAANGASPSSPLPRGELDERFEALLERIALTPVNQLVMMKLLVNQALYAQGLQATQALGVFFDGVARHTPEGYGFARRAAEAGFKQAVRERDEPYAD